MICESRQRFVNHYDAIWDDSAKVRNFVQEQIRVHPEIFPAEIADGFMLSGHLPASKKIQGIRLRQIRIAGQTYSLRPSSVMPYCCGTVEDLEKPWLLLSFGTPCWLITKVFGHNDMF